MIRPVSEFLNFLLTRRGEVLNLFFEHIELTIFSVMLAIMVGIPLGILITRYKKLSSPVIGFANLIQAVPSLALLGFLIPILGIGSKPAILMVFLYSLLPIVKNTYIGLNNINTDTLEAAKGIGMTDGQVLKIVQLPLAFPVIMAGVRISAVTAVGLMTIAAFVGAGGLGYMVFSGVQTVNNNMILAGAIPACILALLMDFFVGRIERGVTPSGIRRSDGTIKVPKNKRHRNNVLLKVGIAGMIIIFLGVGAAVKINKNEKIVIGSKSFSEQLILGNMLADLIENNTNLKVERKLNLEGSNIAFSALKSGELDMYVEYTGTGLVNIMKEPIINDPDKAYEAVKKYFNENYNITWLKPLGFNNTYTLAVRKDTAEKYNLETMSDLAKVSDKLALGCTIEFNNRKDGYPGLKKAYGMNFKEVKPVNGGLRYNSLASKKTDVIDAFLTDGLLKAFDLKVLKDDKMFFPPYYAAPIINNNTLKKHPELEEIIDRLENKLSDEKMRELNYRVDKLGEKPEDVAKNFLKKNGLIN